MALPADLTPLAATNLARGYKLDVDTSPAQDGSVWLRVKGVTEFTYNPGTVGLQPDADYDSDGYGSSTATTFESGGTLTVRRGPGRSTPTAYDPGQEFIRAAGRLLGPQNTIHYRAYEDNGATGSNVEAYEGYAAVSYANGGGDQSALRTATITLTGQGATLPVAHPRTTSLAPAVTALAYVSGGVNVAAAGGDLIRISGSGFNSATAVTVFGNAVAAASRSTVSDNLMIIKVPAHAAGTGNVTVTNAIGTSTTGTANQIVYV